MNAAERRDARRRLLQAAARVQRQRLALADAQAMRAVVGLETAATATAGATLLAALAVVLTRRRPPARSGRWRRWLALAVRAASLLALVGRAARRTA